MSKNTSKKTKKARKLSKSKLSKSKLKKKLDKAFSIYVRLSNRDVDDNCMCCTCGTIKHWTKIQCGHYQSRRYMDTRWHVDNCAPQCMKCNIFSQGEQVKFKYYIDNKYGPGTSTELEQHVEYKYTIEEIQTLILRYEDYARRSNNK